MLRIYGWGVRLKSDVLVYKWYSWKRGRFTNEIVMVVLFSSHCDRNLVKRGRFVNHILFVLTFWFRFSSYSVTSNLWHMGNKQRNWLWFFENFGFLQVTQTWWNDKKPEVWKLKKKNQWKSYILSGFWSKLDFPKNDLKMDFIELWLWLWLWSWECFFRLNWSKVRLWVKFQRIWRMKKVDCLVGGLMDGFIVWLLYN